jgi:hypothetical protein
MSENTQRFLKVVGGMTAAFLILTLLVKVLGCND